MFKNRSMQATVTFPKKSNEDNNEIAASNQYLDPDKMIPIVKDLALDGAKLGFAIYAGARVLNTACKIAEIAAKAKF